VKVSGLILGDPREFIVNMGETGFADRVDARGERVIVLVTYSHATIPIPVDRNIQKLTMVAGIAISFGG
jgi:hypothetical protein